MYTDTHHERQTFQTSTLHYMKEGKEGEQKCESKDDNAHSLLPGTPLTQVIIGAPHCDVLLAVGVFLGFGKLVGQADHLLEHTVGMVSFLLSNLLLEKLIVWE